MAKSTTTPAPDQEEFNITPGVQGPRTDPEEQARNEEAAAEEQSGVVPNREAGNTAPAQSTAGGAVQPAMVRTVTPEEEASVFTTSKDRSEHEKLAEAGRAQTAVDRAERVR